MCACACIYSVDEVQNSEAQLIMLSSGTEFSEPLPIPAEDHGHRTALALWGGRYGWRLVCPTLKESKRKHIFSLEEQVLFFVLYCSTTGFTFLLNLTFSVCMYQPLDSFQHG